MTGLPGVLITRPTGQVGSTLERVRAAGHYAEHLPLLALAPLDSPELDHALARYSAADVAIFVSANAVEFGLAALAARGIAATGPRIAAIGAATAAQLHTAGLAADLVPTAGHDSESLLALPALQSVTGQVILIFRGASEAGGRQTLADTLGGRGADVVVATCYRRDPARHEPARLAAVAHALKTGTVSTLQIMSVESLDALLALFASEPVLRRCRLLVPHARIADAARRAGFADVIVTGLGDEALIAALSTPTSAANP